MNTFGRKTHILQKQGGFTLVEVLVVILIISILAMLVLLGINPSKQRGKLYDIKRRHDLSQLKGIYDLYYTKTLRYPTGAEVCYDTPEEYESGKCQCRICGLEQDIGTFKDVINLLYCDPEHPRKTYLYQYECGASPGWYKLYTTLSASDSEGNACSFGVTNKPNEFLEPYPTTCNLEEGNPVGGGGGGGGGGGAPSCPADPAPKYCRLGGICNICGTFANCLVPSSCDQPTALYNDSLCISQCQ